MRSSTVLIIALSVVVLPFGRAGDGAAAQDASPLAAPTGRTLYAFETDEGFNTYTFFDDTGAEVVAFDAQFTPDLAEQAIAYPRTQTDTPPADLVITRSTPTSSTA